MLTKNTAGFTLVELMIVVVIAGILLAIAVPGLVTLLENNRIQTGVDTLYASLMTARSEALSRNQPVIMCKSADGASCVTSGDWEQGWLIFADADRDAAQDPNDPIIRVGRALESGDTMRVTGSAFDDYVEYRVDGSATGAGTFTSERFIVCNSAGDADRARGVEIGLTGRPRFLLSGITDCTP